MILAKQLSNEELINKACKMVNKTKIELENLNYKNSCSESIYKCIYKKCPSLNMCYDGLEIIE